MKPIFQSIQKQIIACLQKETAFQSLAIVPESFDFLEKLKTKAVSLAPLKLYVSIPFPLETAVNVSALCWEKLSLYCTLISNRFNIEKAAFLDLSESICYFMAHKYFNQDQWEGCFILDPKNPWKWLDIDNGLGLQMHFITSQFSQLF